MHTKKQITFRNIILLPNQLSPFFIPAKIFHFDQFDFYLFLFLAYVRPLIIH
jgi:hypothetical protein